MSELTFSDYVSPNSNQPVTITLEAALQGGSQVGANVTGLQGLGIFFLRTIGTASYPHIRVMTSFQGDTFCMELNGEIGVIDWYAPNKKKNVTCWVICGF